MHSPNRFGGLNPDELSNGIPLRMGTRDLKQAPKRLRSFDKMCLEIHESKRKPSKLNSVTQSAFVTEQAAAAPSNQPGNYFKSKRAYTKSIANEENQLSVRQSRGFGKFVDFKKFQNQLTVD